MGGGHSHHARSKHDEEVPIAAGARGVLFAGLGVVAAVTVAALITLWPQYHPHPSKAAAFATPGSTFPHARVLTTQPACGSRSSAGGGTPSAGEKCGGLVVRVTSGSQAGRTITLSVPPETLRSGLSPGDSVQLLQTPSRQGQPVTFSLFNVDRSTPLWWLAAIFVVAVAVVARLRGVLALVGLGFGAVVLVKFMLPALLTGEPAVAVALTGSTAIMYVVLYLAHGPSMRTSAALAGTLVGIGITAVVGVVGVHTQRLSGVPDETGQFLGSFVGDLNFQGLLTCAVIIAGLGVLNDVTITQASAVWELRAASPEMPRRTLFGSAMRIGRDHIASTIYTIVFAYAGSALTVLLLLFFYQRPLLYLLTTEGIAEEITRTLASAIGLILAVPATTAIAVASVAPVRRRGRRRR